MRVPRRHSETRLFEPSFNCCESLWVIVGRGVHVERVESHPFAELFFGKRNATEMRRGRWQKTHECFSNGAPVARPTVDWPAHGFGSG